MKIEHFKHLSGPAICRYFEDNKNIFLRIDFHPRIYFQQALIDKYSFISRADYLTSGWATGYYED